MNISRESHRKTLYALQTENWLLLQGTPKLSKRKQFNTEDIKEI